MNQLEGVSFFLQVASLVNTIPSNLNGSFHELPLLVRQFKFIHDGDDKVLIDDNDIDLFIHQKLIKFVNPKCCIKSFSNVRDALDQIKLTFESNVQNFPDFILLDLNIPLFDGFYFIEESEFITLLSEKKPLIIILTCSVDPVVYRKH